MLNQEFCTLLTCTLAVVSAFCWSLAAIPPPGVQAIAVQPRADLPLGFSADNRASFAHAPQELSSVNFLRPFAATLITETKKITASDGANFDQLGLTVALSGDTAVVGANQDPADPGAAYVFERNYGGAKYCWWIGS